ncbi:hypothetical protein AGMMS49940_07360 [Spirochaetia bacterium]|nr:hypothetical protein AGMMS49940_07360 [Spirochaetia bacterium]
MKRVVFAFVLVLATVSATYAQICYAETTFNSEKNRMLEIARSGKLPNGCGAAGTPDKLVAILNSLGDGGACDRHDRAYSMPGMSKREADNNFRSDLQAAGVPSFLVTIFYNAVAYGGQSAYDSAQANARRFQQLEEEPSSRQYSIPSDSPYSW